MNLDALQQALGKLTFGAVAAVRTRTSPASTASRMGNTSPSPSPTTTTTTTTTFVMSTSPSSSGAVRGIRGSRSRSTSPQPRTHISSCASPPTPPPCCPCCGGHQQQQHHQQQQQQQQPQRGAGSQLLSASSSSSSSSPSPIRPPAPYQDIRVDADGNTPLILAAAAGNFLGVEQALLGGAINSVDTQNFRGETALFAACLARRGITAEILLKRGGADASLCNAESVSPLHVAASLDSERIVRALMNAGASARVKDEEGDTPLHWAIREHAERAARAIVDLAGPEVILLKNDDGETPADLAAEIGDSEAATWLGLSVAVDCS